MPFITELAIKGFDSYKYVSIDNSPLAIYIMHPFWNWVVKGLPMWLAPNLMTFIGFLLCAFNCLILSYYDFDFTASSIEIDSPRIPDHIWLLCAIFNFLSHTLDGCDGKQARRTKSSSPLGELFDHGCDSWSTPFFAMTLYSVFGCGIWGVSYMTFFNVYWVVIGTFIISHWEKYLTGVFYLPWTYDISQIAITVAYLLTYLFGGNIWNHHILSTGINITQFLSYSVSLSFWFVSLPITFWHIYSSYADKTGRMLSLVEALRPLVSIAILLISCYTWVFISPGNVFNKHPRVFLFLIGTVFSNIVSRLIIAQMSSTRAQLLNKMAIMYAAVMVAAICLPQYEIILLYSFTGLAIILHVIFGIVVVNKLLDHFGLRAFILSQPSPTANTKKSS